MLARLERTAYRALWLLMASPAGTFFVNRRSGVQIPHPAPFPSDHCRLGHRGRRLHRQSCLQGAGRGGPPADLLRHVGERPRLGRALGAARTRRHRRRGASRRRVPQPPPERKPKVGGSNPSPGTILLRAYALRRTSPDARARSRMPSEALAKEGSRTSAHSRMTAVVLVTGGAGYIGSHVCKALAEVRADSRSATTRWRRATTGRCAGARWSAATSAMASASTRCSAATARGRSIHLAGYIEVGELVRQPERYLHNNATKTDALIDAALRHGVEAFVFSSTCAVYGLPQSDLLAEIASPSRRSAPMPSPRRGSSARSPSRGGTRPALGVAALLQCRRRRRRRRDRRGAPAGDPSAAARRRRRARPRRRRSPCSAPTIRRRRLVRARLRPCQRPRRRPSAGARLAAAQQPARGLHEAFNLGSGSGYSVRQAIAETARIAGRPCRTRSGRAGRAIRPSWSATSPRPGASSAGSRQRDLAAQIEDTLRWRREDAALDSGEPERQAAQALAGRGEDRVGDCRRDRRRAGLADAADRSTSRYRRCAPPSPAHRPGARRRSR